MNEKQKLLFKNSRFHTVVYNGNKYSSHYKAIMFNDFKQRYPDCVYLSFADLESYHRASYEAVEMANQLSNTNLKISVPFFYIDVLDIDYDTFKGKNDCINEMGEAQVIFYFINYIMEKTEKNIVIFNDEYDADTFKRKYDGDINSLFDLIYNDIKGFVTISDISIEDYYKALVINNLCIEHFLTQNRVKIF